MTPWKCSAPTFSVTEALIAWNAFPYRVGIPQVQQHAADVGLVRDGHRIELEHDREADLLRRLHRLVLGDGDPRLDRRNAVGLQQLLRLVLGQDRAALLAGVANDALRLSPLQRGIVVGGKVGVS